MTHYEINSAGARINPNLPIKDDIYVQVRKHRELRAKGSVAEQIERELNT